VKAHERLALGRVGGQRLALAGGPEADLPVEAAGGGVLVGHPQDHLVRVALGGPPDGPIDQGAGHAPAAVPGVDPHGHEMDPAGPVGLGEDPGQADVGAAVAGDEGRRPGVVPGPSPPDVVGEGQLHLQGAGEGAGRVGQRPQP
jgi:hypothetical protein